MEKQEGEEDGMMMMSMRRRVGRDLKSTWAAGPRHRLDVFISCCLQKQHQRL